MLEEAHAKSHGSGRGEQRKTPEKSGMADWERKGSGENQGKKDRDGDSRLGIRWICSPCPKIPQEFRDNARLPCPHLAPGTGGIFQRFLIPAGSQKSLHLHGLNPIPAKTGTSHGFHPLFPAFPTEFRWFCVPAPPIQVFHGCCPLGIPGNAFPSRISQRDIPRNSCWWGSGMSPGIPLDPPRLDPGEFFIPAFSRDPKMLPQDLFQHLGISQQLRDPFGTSGILGPVGNVGTLDPPGRGVGKIPPPPIPEGNVFIPFLIPPFPRILPT